MICSIRLILPREQALLKIFPSSKCVVFCVNLDFCFIHFTNTSIANLYHIIYTPAGLVSLQHLPYYLHTCWTCIFATFTILSTHLLDLYLCLPSAILVKISIFAANRPDMSSGLAGESTDPKRDMKTIEIKDRIISCGQKTTPLTPRRSRSCIKTYINIIM